MVDSIKQISRREWKTILAGCVIAFVFVSAGAFALSEIKNRDSEETAARLHASAVSSLDNCSQIESLKTQVRESIIKSKTRLPTFSYYKEHPDELKSALKDTDSAIKRFAENDCYKLSVVVQVGIKKPAPKKKK